MDYVKFSQTVNDASVEIAKSDSENGSSYDLFKITTKFENAEPYQKSFLDNKALTSDFKEFYNLVSSALAKLIYFTKTKSPNVQIMNMLALQALSLSAFLKSIESNLDIRHHYERLEKLVQEAKTVLSSKKKQYEKIVRAQIDRTYPSMASDWVSRKFTYYDRVKKVRLEAKECVDSRIGMEERHKILKNYIDNEYVPNRLNETLGKVIEFLNNTDQVKEITQSKSDLRV